MKVGGAWPSSIAEGEKTVAEICRQRPAAVGDTP
jgi:hypothetical protein